MTNIAAVYKHENRKRAFLCRIFILFEHVSLHNNFVRKLHQAWLGGLFTLEADLARVTPHDTILDIGPTPRLLRNPRTTHHHHH
jgi:hypothetical protein